jgi:hypothetical protein
MLIHCKLAVMQTLIIICILVSQPLNKGTYVAESLTNGFVTECCIN